ncbi:MAG: hypothetical protein U9N82_02940 [Thermodesulfobacteriota bacterium]|nr:hypothetical protein [Thermodesulfobacteriota bacterium]
MKHINQVVAKGLFIILLFAFMISCASIPVLKVNYQLPPSSDELKGKKVFLIVEDARKTKEFLGKGASKELSNFPGNFAFSVTRYGGAGFKIGFFHVRDMVVEAFKRRLENTGLDLVQEESHGDPVLLIILNEFVLDLVDRRWIVNMSYEAILKKEGRVLSTQIISGEAERYKLAGWGAADIVLGEIFSDMVNRLDVDRLFQKVNL